MPDQSTIALILFGGLAVLILLRVPLGFSLAVAGMAAYLVGGDSLLTMAQSYYDSVNSFPLIAVPMFFLAGIVMERGGLSRRLVDVAEAMIGGIRGGLGMVTILASMFFSAISGSGPATTAAVGGVMVPSLLERKYPRGFAGAIVATGGTLGVMIPPSILLILYGVITGVSITGLFMAALLPGLLIGVGLIVFVHIMCRIMGVHAVESRFNLARLMTSIRKGILAILAPIIILGGIYSGIFTPTESAVVAAVYGIIVAMFVYRELTPKGLWESVKETMSITGRLGIIWAVSTAYGEVMAMYQIPSMLSEWLMSITRNPYVIWLLICIFLTFMGCIMNSMSQVIIFTPIFAPVVQAVGIDLMHFAIIFVLNAEIGFLTPPLGTNLFVAMDQAKCSLGEISKAVIPFILFLFLMMAILIILPQISLWLPQTFLSV
ncbi:MULTISPECIES: TRAP transporter large permease [Desulfovibrio]|uniref:TRAP transporter large permease n=2 Tax=Desulfovibrionaceae TaxID=194924 RepID=UPI0025A390DF|nr:TRAP transporter large permease [Desulfovibrio piger]MCI7616457.1 TRAP transporter large permease [Desulfovibrio piger]MDM8329914.1 TRAP transporter large permease [Desulfovibrio piger]